MNIENLKIICELVAKNASISAEFKVIEPVIQLPSELHPTTFYADQIRITLDSTDHRDALRALIIKEIHILFPVDSLSSSLTTNFLSDSFHYSHRGCVTVISNNVETSLDGFQPQLLIQLRYHGTIVKPANVTIVEIGRAILPRVAILSLKIAVNDSAFAHNIRIKIEDLSHDQFKVVAVGADHDMSMTLVRILVIEISRRIIAGFKPHSSSSKKVSEEAYKTTYLIRHSSEISLVTRDKEPAVYVQFVEYSES